MPRVEGGLGDPPSNHVTAEPACAAVASTATTAHASAHADVRAREKIALRTALRGASLWTSREGVGVPNPTQLAKHTPVDAPPVQRPFANTSLAKFFRLRARV